MTRTFSRSLLAVTALWACPWLASPSYAQTATIDPQAIESITGLKLTRAEEAGVFKIGKPRDDIRFTVDGTPMPPFMGLTSTAMFMMGHGSGAMVMGDTVLLEDEVNPVMSAALDLGLEVTALHNHFFFDEPRVYFMHIGGQGDPAQLARAIKSMYDKVAEIRAANGRPAVQFGTNSVANTNTITPAPLKAVFDTQGESNNGMFKVVFGRTAEMHGLTFGKDMGLNTWAAFAGSDDNAVMAGDLAMLEGELQPVLKSLRKDGINIVAIHQHMSGEQPRYLFLHYWGKGKAVELAQSLKRALDAQVNLQWRPTYGD